MKKFYKLVIVCGVIIVLLQQGTNLNKIPQMGRKVVETVIDKEAKLLIDSVKSIVVKINEENDRSKVKLRTLEYKQKCLIRQTDTILMEQQTDLYGHDHKKLLP